MGAAEVELLEQQLQKPQCLDLKTLRAIKVLGRGATGTVFLVSDSSSSGPPFALKVVDKTPPPHSTTSRLGAARRARWEMSLLSRLPSHPSLPTLLATLETPELLAWALPYCPGGDLNSLRHRLTDRVFSPSAIRFYSAEIVSALHSLHLSSLVYRDLKPENILIQPSGHLLLADFDLSRPLPPRTSAPARCSLDSSAPRRRRGLSRLLSLAPDPDRTSPASATRRSLDAAELSHSFVGTEEYVAPEVVRGDGHDFGVDWWALGVLIYEMAYGRTPFRAHCRKETFRNILTKPPEHVGRPSEMTDLISRLLEKDPSRRLGAERGAAEIRGHPFFRGVRWELLAEIARPPFLAPPEDDAEEITATDCIDIREHMRRQRQRLKATPSETSPSMLSGSLRDFSSDCTRSDSSAESLTPRT